MPKFALICALFVFGWALAAEADVISLEFRYLTPTVTLTDLGHTVQLENCQTMAHVGEPLLPIQGITLLLFPSHEIVQVSIDPGEPDSLVGNYDMAVAQRQYPLSSSDPPEWIGLSAILVGSLDPHPNHLANGEQTNFLAGQSIGSFILHPVRYVPATGTILYYTRLEVRILTEPTSRASRAYDLFYRGSNTDRLRVHRLSQNPQLEAHNSQMMATYPAQQSRENTYDLLLISSENLLQEFELYLQYKAIRGWNVLSKTVEAIYSGYPGLDNQERIRNCIADCYSTHGIEYVLLGGDDEIIPHRGLLADPGGGYADDDIAADLYYAALDGDWNSDGDTLWGEPGEGDLLAEVLIGRVCADNAQEVAVFVNKTVSYEGSPVVGECTEALMVGELLWDDPTWGGDYKDEIIYGAWTYGDATVGFPSNFNIRTLYDKNTTGNWNALLNLLPLLNSGVHIVNHMGHATVDYYMRFNNSNVTNTNFTNNGTDHSFYITYSQGCYCGSFDNRSSGGGISDEDCINERITVEIEHGAVASIANSRYGWGMHLGTNGASQYYDRQFFDALFGEEIFTIGWTNQDSKEDNIPYIGYPLQRWCYYEINLFGDPTLDIWTHQPVQMVVDYPDTIPVGCQGFGLTVEGVHGARVAVSNEGRLVGRGFTDEAGMAAVEFSSLPDAQSALDLWITAHDKLAYHGVVYCEVFSEAYVFCVESIIDDDQSGASWGNGDGEVELGETVELEITLANIGGDTARSVSAELSTSENCVFFSQDIQAFGDIAPGAQALSPGSYLFSVGDNCADGTDITIRVSCLSDTSRWDSYLPLSLRAPLLLLSGVEIAELIGDGDGHLDPGETASIGVELRNNGGGTGWSIGAALTTIDAYTVISTGTCLFSDIAPDSVSGSTAPFQVAFNEDAPLGNVVEFTLEVTGAGGYSESLAFEMAVGRKSLLVVDADNEGTEYRLMEALAELGEEYDYWSWYEDGPPGFGQLDRYQVVLWAAGDQNVSSCHAGDRADIAEYLDSGGSFLFSAENYLSAYADEPFTTDYLHVADLKTNVAISDSAVGTAGDPISEGLGIVLSWPTDLSESPDSIIPDSASSVVFSLSETLIPTVIRYPTYGDSLYRIMFFSTPLEAFCDTGSGDNRIAGVVKRSLAWLRGREDCQAPSVPSAVSLTPGGVLMWNASTDNIGVESYAIYRSTLAFFDIVDHPPFAATSATILDVSESVGDPAVNYYFAVTANDIAENESWPSAPVGEHDYDNHIP